jgi:protein-L-isoaspartate(D-aspartate) O-methyltransferase
MIDFAATRARMVEVQIERRGIRDPNVLEAMRRVPREAFVAPGYESAAYDDTPLPIGSGQTISQPYIVALMVEAAAVSPGAHVLEVGAGSGYAAAVLAEIAAAVVTVERHVELAEAARARLARLGYRNVQVEVGDGALGWPAAAPFDAILVAAGGTSVPEPLKRQLAEGGRLVIPVGPRWADQKLIRLTRRGETWREERITAVRFVPLVTRADPS